MERLDLLDINNFIQKNELKEVTSSRAFKGGSSTSFDDTGLWSETIFGTLGSRKRQIKFGYITFQSTMIMPIIYKKFSSLSPVVKNILQEKDTYTVISGDIKQSDNGETGIKFFVDNYNDIDFRKVAKSDKSDIGEFVEKNKKKIFIDKYLIIPAGKRDFMFQEGSATRQISPEINQIYEKIIMINNHIKNMGADPFLLNNMQKLLNECYEWIKNKMTGKEGIMKGKVLKKTCDYSARMVASSDNDIPLGSIGLPWHTTMALFEPFFFYYLDSELKQEIINILELDDDSNLDFQDFKHFVKICLKDPSYISDETIDRIIKTGKKFIDDKYVLVKRDPVVSRSSYYSANVIMLKKGRAAVVNPLTCKAQDLDFDGDAIAIYAVFTNEANKQAEKMNPAKSKSVWLNPTRSNEQVYKIDLDGLATLYKMTKN